MTENLTPAIREYLSKIGKKGGAATKGITSPRKAKSSAKNGAKGGRPKIAGGTAADKKRREYLREMKRKSRERAKSRLSS